VEHSKQLPHSMRENQFKQIWRSSPSGGSAIVLPLACICCLSACHVAISLRVTSKVHSFINYVVTVAKIRSLLVVTGLHNYKLWLPMPGSQLPVHSMLQVCIQPGCRLDLPQGQLALHYCG